VEQQKTIAIDIPPSPIRKDRESAKVGHPALSQWEDALTRGSHPARVREVLLEGDVDRFAGGGAMSGNGGGA
jgi:hypothetical protein